MNKRLLIISPYFPPSNTADMQRIRMSLPYFEAYDWDAEVVIVDQKYADLQKDELLMLSLPGNNKIHTVKAFSKKWTSKLGFGNIAFRSLWFYWQKVNQILKSGTYDLIYFSTTQFSVCILGAYWKKKFKIPYVIDMQDPWYSDYYYGKTKDQQPPKFRFTYLIHKYLEPIAIKNSDGLISVSAGYINTLKTRYPSIKHIPSAVIPFGAFEKDIQIAEDNKAGFPSILDKGFINIVYAGRGGIDMHKAIAPVFKVIGSDQKFKPLRFYFIGTSYAKEGAGKLTIMPLAEKYGIADQAVEIPGRISYYHTLNILQQADALFIPGSEDPKYSASKIYPYLLVKKAMIALFNQDSPVLPILNEYDSLYAYNYNDPDIEKKVFSFLSQLMNKEISEPTYNQEAINKYAAENLTRQQCNLFNMVLNKA